MAKVAGPLPGTGHTCNVTIRQPAIEFQLCLLAWTKFIPRFTIGFYCSIFRIPHITSYSEHHLMVPEHFYCWVAGSFNPTSKCHVTEKPLSNNVTIKYINSVERLFQMHSSQIRLIVHSLKEPATQQLKCPETIKWYPL